MELLDYEELLEKCDKEYYRLQSEQYAADYIVNGKIRSNQIKALLRVLVEAINEKDLEQI